MDAPDVIPYDQVPAPQGFQGSAQQTQPQQDSAPDVIPYDQVAAPEGFEQPPQQPETSTLRAAAEGAAKGLIGPVAPWAEHKFLRIPYAEMKKTTEEHPMASALGEGAGFVGGALMGTGEAAVINNASEGLLKAANIANPTSFLGKVGSSMAKNAAETALLQSSDEASKYMIDPDFSAQSAMSNIGLAGVAGGALGGIGTGIISPLWKATVGAEADKLMGAAKSSINAENALNLPDEVGQAADKLGLAMDATQRASISENPAGRQIISDMIRKENPEVLESLDKFHNNIVESVANSLDTSLDGAKNYSKYEEGKALEQALEKEVKSRYDIIQPEMEARKAATSGMDLFPDDRNAAAAKIMDDFMENDAMKQRAEYFGKVRNIAETVGEQTNVKGLNDLLSNVGKRIGNHALDPNEKTALQRIYGSLSDYRDSAIEKAMGQTEGPAAVLKHQQQNAMYKEYAQEMGEFLDHMGLDKFKGTEGLISKFTKSLSPEEVSQKLTFKGNENFAQFLEKNMPELYNTVKQKEAKEFLSGVVKSGIKKGEEIPLDVDKLSENIVDSKFPEYVKRIIPQEALDKIEAARTISHNIVNPKNTGIPAGLWNMFMNAIPGLGSAVSWMTGHGPIGGAVAGKATELFGKKQDAMRLGWLKWLASDKPVSGSAFNSMVTTLHHSLQFAKQLPKAAQAIIQPGGQIAINTADLAKKRQKLDKFLDDQQKNPDMLAQGMSKSELGHYMPEHQASEANATTNAVQYLQNLKPKPQQSGPLGKEIQPSQIQQVRYNKALDISNNPLIVMKDVKNGTLKPSDIQDLKSIYPAVYANMAQNISMEMMSAKSKGIQIPYKTRMSMSLFLGQPLDNTMSPGSIQSSQNQFMINQQRPPANNKVKDMKKSAELSRTKSQAAEAENQSDK